MILYVSTVILREQPKVSRVIKTLGCRLGRRRYVVGGFCGCETDPEAATFAARSYEVSLRQAIQSEQHHGLIVTYINGSALSSSRHVRVFSSTNRSESCAKG